MVIVILYIKKKLLFYTAKLLFNYQIETYLYMFIDNPVATIK